MEPFYVFALMFSFFFSHFKFPSISVVQESGATLFCCEAANMTDECMYFIFGVELYRLAG